MKSTDLDQSREHFRLEFPFSLQTFPCLGRRASLFKVAYLSFFVFVFWLSISFFWTDGAQYVGELKPQTILSTNCELTPREVEHSSRSKYEITLQTTVATPRVIIIDCS